MSTTLETRLESYVKVDLQERERQVLDALRGEAMSGTEIGAYLNVPASWIRPRLTALRDRGVIRETGRTAWNVMSKRNEVIFELIKK